MKKKGLKTRMDLSSGELKRTTHAVEEVLPESDGYDRVAMEKPTVYGREAFRHLPEECDCDQPRSKGAPGDRYPVRGRKKARPGDAVYVPTEELEDEFQQAEEEDFDGDDIDNDGNGYPGGGSGWARTYGVNDADDFVGFAAEAQAKYEYHSGYIVDMSGGSPDHAAIIANIMGEIRNKLRQKGSRCRIFSSDLMVYIWQNDCILLPDVSVICGPPEHSPNVRNAVINPVFIVEVLSPSTADRDYHEKFESYKLLPTFREYLLVSQECYMVERHFKTRGGIWKRVTYMSIDQEVKIESLGISVGMEFIYENIRGLMNYFVIPERKNGGRGKTA